MEMARVYDHDRFFRLPPDNRTLNYRKYYEEGKEIAKEFTEYTSHNTKRLNVPQIESLLLGLDFIKMELENR